MLRIELIKNLASRLRDHEVVMNLYITLRFFRLNDNQTGRAYALPVGFLPLREGCCKEDPSK